MAKRLYTGHSCFSLQFFKKRSILYVYSSTFNVSIYTLCHTAWLTDTTGSLPGKRASRAQTGRKWQEHHERYAIQVVLPSCVRLYVLILGRGWDYLLAFWPEGDNCFQVKQSCVLCVREIEEPVDEVKLQANCSAFSIPDVDYSQVTMRFIQSSNSVQACWLV